MFVNKIILIHGNVKIIDCECKNIIVRNINNLDSIQKYIFLNRVSNGFFNNTIFLNILFILMRI